MIPYGKHSIIDEDVAAVVDVLENKFLTQGETVPAFEKSLCDYTGAQFATAVNSGTSGLHVACLALGIGPGDSIWTSPNSFVASANCALYCGATVDFVDIDPESRNLSVSALKQKLQAAQRENCLPKALVMVHFAGLSEYIEELSAILKSYNVALIEDAAHGLGGHDNGTKIGSCRYSDIAVLSFHPVKSITTAEGGAVMTNDSDLAEKIVLYAKHGITRDESKLTEQHGPWYYQQQLLGFNYRLSDLHAALGITQLQRLDTFVAARRKLAHRYHQLLSDLPLQLPKQIAEESDGSAWHLYMVEVLEHDRATVFEGLRAAGIGVNVHYIPIHLQPYYQALGFTAGQFPNAERFYQRAITLPLYPTLSESEQDIVVNALKEQLS